jgi:hypothetical protein
MAGVDLVASPGASLSIRSRRLVPLIVTLLAVSATSALWLTASASHLPVADPNDTRGQLDVRRVEVLGQKRPRWKVITWTSWTTAQIFDTGYGMIYLDTFGGQRADYYILVGSLGGRLYADLYRDRAEKRDLYVSAVSRVGRSDKTSFYVRLALGRLKIGDERTFFRWRAETLFTGDRCRRVCFDPVPDVGLVTEPLPIETPSPTPTPTPSPSTTD